MWQSFVDLIAGSLTAIAGIVAAFGLPYSFGFSIIIFTIIIKVLTLPLTFKQLNASKRMQELQPELQKLQKKYGKKDREKLAQEQMKLYREAGVNPLGGCLPTLIQMPIWFALYRALFNMAENGVLGEGFFFIPSLADPQGLGWLWPLPPSVGWGAALAFLVLPVVTVVTQLAVQRMMTPPTPDPQQQSMQQIMMFMPFMFGFFALQVPSGLALYWVTTNVLMIAQQYWMNRSSLNLGSILAPSAGKTATAKPNTSEREHE